LIDYFTLALTCGLITLALWRLLWRDDLDRDSGAAPVRRRPWVKGDDAGELPADRDGR
jgi:hypothetical protein